MTIWVFQGGTAGWFTSSSWLSTGQPPLNGVPGAGDIAEIGGGTAEMGAESDTIAALYLSGGNLTGSSTLTTTGGSALTGGYVGGSLTLDLQGASVLGGGQFGGSVVVDNAGTVTQNGNVTLGDSTGLSATIFNAAGATFNIANAVSIAGGAATAVFRNAGTLSALAGSGLSTISASIFNTGTISAAKDAVLALSGGGTLGGSIGGGGGNVALTGYFDVSSGQTQTVSFAAGSSFSGVGDGTAFLSGAGTISSSGTLAITNNNRVALELGNGVTWLNNGLLNDSGDTAFGFGGGDNVTLINAATGTINLTGTSIVFQNANGGSGTIVNAGHLADTLSSGTTLLEVAVANTGEISAAKGGVLVLNGGSLGGTIGGGGGQVELGGIYGVSAGNTQSVNFAAGASFAGAGVGLATLSGLGTIVSSGTLSILYNNTFSLALANDVTWQNSGLVNDGGDTYFGVSGGDDVTLVNAGGATFNITAGGVVFQDANGGAGQIANGGLLSGDGGRSIIDVAVANAGTISAVTGSVLVLDGGTLGGVIGGGGGQVQLGGTYTVPTATTQSVNFVAGASFAGAGVGTAVLSGGGTLVSSGTLSIVANNSFSLALVNDVTWKSTGLVFDGGDAYFGGSGADDVTLINASGATLNITAGGVVFQNANGGGGQIDNSGLLRSYGGSHATIDVAVNNSGGIQATAGGVLVLNGGTLGGEFGGGNGQVELGGTYNVSTGTTQTVNFVTGASFAGAGVGTAFLSGGGTLVSRGTLSILYNNTFSLALGNGVTWSSTGVVNDGGDTYFGLSGGDYVTLVNASGAVFNITAGGLVFQTANGGAGQIDNNGLLDVVSASSAIGVYVDNTGTLSVSAGGTLSLTAGLENAASGEMEVSSGNTISVSSGFTNNGVIAALGGVVTLSSGVTGTGEAVVGAGGTLQVGGADGQIVAFDGSGAVLVLESASQFSGAISGLGFGDTLDFAGLTVSSASLAGGTLTIVSNGGTFHYLVSGALTGTDFTLQPDGNGGTDVEVGVPGQTFTLTTGVDSFLGGIGNDNFIAATSTLSAGDSIDGASGVNTLTLIGAGSFNLAAPAALNHIQIVDAAETGQTITLRAGTSYAVNVASGTTADAIVGANNTDVINLGTAADKVTIGGAGETIDGPGTNYVLSAAGSAAGALINLATGANALTISGGGAIGLNAGDNGLSKVTLAAAATAYSFVANAEIGLQIVDLSSGSDTVTAGGIGEILSGGAAGHLTMIGFAGGGTRFLDSSALLNGDTVKNLATVGSELDLSDLNFANFSGTFTENSSGTVGTLHVSDGTHAASVFVTGSFAAAGFSGSLASAGFVVSSDGHTGTAISFH